jgi:hypothetical protein
MIVRTIFLVVIIFLINFLMVSPFDAGEDLCHRKLTLAVVALAISIMSQTVNVHVLSAAGVGAQCNLLIRVEYLSAYAARLQLRHQFVATNGQLLAEEKRVEVVEVCIGDLL